MTEEEETAPLPKKTLDDDDRYHITEIFEGEIADRLLGMDAKSGNISCEFAGHQYRNWVLEFTSSRWGLKIVDFEYDENTRSFNLPRTAAILEKP